MKFTVELYAVEWCGFSHYYEVEVDDEAHAEDAALEKHEQEFVDMYSLLSTEDGYIESEDYDSETDEYDADDCSTIAAKVIY